MSSSLCCSTRCPDDSLIFASPIGGGSTISNSSRRGGGLSTRTTAVDLGFSDPIRLFFLMVAIRFFVATRIRRSRCSGVMLAHPPWYFFSGVAAVSLFFTRELLSRNGYSMDRSLVRSDFLHLANIQDLDDGADLSPVHELHSAVVGRPGSKIPAAHIPLSLCWIPEAIWPGGVFLWIAVRFIIGHDYPQLRLGCQCFLLWRTKKRERLVGRPLNLIAG